jgi:hypothetical protein
MPLLTSFTIVWRLGSSNGVGHVGMNDRWLKGEDRSVDKCRRLACGGKRGSPADGNRVWDGYQLKR